MVCIQGDSAFGFSGMEVEVACRVGCRSSSIIINNGGIGFGVAAADSIPDPGGGLLPDARYERVIEAFGGRGFYAGSIAELGPALEAALRSDAPSLVNVPIDPKATRKAQPFSWLTRS